MFDEIAKANEKKQQKEIEARIKRLEGLADDFLQVLVAADLVLDDVQLVLKCINHKVQQGGLKVKLSVIL